jgi:hypothetical protein
MANSSNSGSSVSVTRSDCHHRQCSSDNCTTTLFGNMGKRLGDNSYDIGCDTILSANMDDLAFETCWEFEYTDDVDPDSWQLCVGWQFGC